MTLPDAATPYWEANPNNRLTLAGPGTPTRTKAGAYQTVGAAASVFHPVPAPESSELQQLVAQIAARIGHALEGRGLVERDLEKAWLSADTEAGPLDDLLGHSITYPIAVGPRAGQKLFGPDGRLKFISAGGVTHEHETSHAAGRLKSPPRRSPPRGSVPASVTCCAARAVPPACRRSSPPPRAAMRRGASGR
jgi:hypothetical protein